VAAAYRQPVVLAIRLLRLQQQLLLVMMMMQSQLCRYPVLTNPQQQQQLQLQRQWYVS
jgi:hypothetical protein